MIGGLALKKRLFDTIVAFLLLMIISPLLLILAAIVRCFLGAPILFAQERPGLLGKPFQIYKFRTMTEEYAPAGSLKSDAERITPLGRWLRSTSLDELPELFNVVKGDMSLIGPRPLLTEYLPLYSPEQARRHEVKPGITGWAQVNGRNAISWEEKFKLDVWYVDHQSFWLDLKILFLTALRVVQSNGISHPGHETMPKFTGTVGE